MTSWLPLIIGGSGLLLIWCLLWPRDERHRPEPTLRDGDQGPG